MDCLNNEYYLPVYVNKLMDSSNLMSPDIFISEFISSDDFCQRRLLCEQNSEKLADIFKDLHFNVINKLLTTLNNLLLNFYLLQKEDVIIKINTCDLLYIFIQNICIDNVPEKTSQRILSNLTLCIKHITKLLRRELNNISNEIIISKYIRLLRLFFEFIIILPEESIISQGLLCINKLKMSSNYTDFSFIFPNLKIKFIIKIQEIIRDFFPLKYEWILLLIAKLRYMLKIYELNSSIIKQLVDFILKDMMVVNINDENYTKYWELICSNFHVFYECKALLEINIYLKSFSNKLLCYLLHDKKELDYLSKNFILNWEQSGFSQMSDLHYTIIEEIVLILQKCFKLIGLKKRKWESTNDSANNCVEILKFIESDDKSEIQNLFEQSLKPPNKAISCDEQAFASLMKISLDLIMPHLSHKLKSHLVIIYMMQINYLTPQMLHIVISVVKYSVNDRQCCFDLIQILNTSLLVQWVNHCINKPQAENLVTLEDCIDIRNQILFCGLRMANQMQLLDSYFNQVHLESKLVITKHNELHAQEMIHLMEQMLKVLHRHYIREDVKKKLLSFLNLYAKEYYRFLKNGMLKNSEDQSLGNDVNIEVLAKGFVYSIQSLSMDVVDSSIILDKLLLKVPAILKLSLDLISSTENYQNIKNSVFIISYIAQNFSTFKQYISNESINKTWECILEKINTILSRMKITNKIEEFKMFLLAGSKEMNLSKNMDCLLIKKLCNVMPIILFSLESNDIEIHVKNLINKLQLINNDENISKKLSAIIIWNEVLTFLPSSDAVINEIMYKYNQKILVIYSLLMIAEITSFLSLQILNSVLKFAALNSDFFGLPELSLSFQLFSIVGSKFPLETFWNFNDVIIFMHLYHSFLNDLLLFHTDIVIIQILVFIGHVRLLIRSSISIGDQNIARDTFQMNKVISVSHFLYRLSQLMCEYKTDFTKVAPYLISEYVCLLQTTTLYPAIKRNLEPAVHKWIDISNTFAISHLHVTLPQGARQIFKNIYNEFVKYYKYNKMN